MPDGKDPETTAATSAEADREGVAEDQRHARAARTSATEVEIKPLNRRQAVSFECLKSALYHEDREHLFDRRHRFLMLFVTLSGTAAFAAIVQPTIADARWIALSTTLAGVMDLVLNWSRKARDHATLRRRFLDLKAEVDSGGVDEAHAEAALNRLYAEEPGCYRIANAVAYNSAMRIMGRADRDLLVVAMPYYLIRHWWKADGFDPSTKSEQASIR